jgi:uncharacterized membrane protein
MIFIACLAGGSILAAIIFSAVSGLAGFGVEREIWLGMLGPALASVISRIAMERQKRLNPQKILKHIIQGFVIKFLFFGVYIAVLVKSNQVRPGAFIGFFVFFYLALHMAEAIELRRTQVRLAMNDTNRQ